MPPEPRVADFPGVMLAQTWDPDKHDPTGWWISEKLDGVRAIWNGKQLLTRTAVAIDAPEWFTSALPAGRILDGELYMGRGRFQETSGAVRRKNQSHPHWRELRYLVFDQPRADGDLIDRLADAKLRISRTSLPSHVGIVDQVVCEGREHLLGVLREMQLLGAEGLIIRRGAAPWVATRSHDMLKVKTQDESDAMVTGYTKGEGRHAGRVGALECQFTVSPWTAFCCGTGLSDHDREHPPKISDIIRVGHHGKTKDGLPRFPVFLGVRAEGAV